MQRTAVFPQAVETDADAVIDGGFDQVSDQVIDQVIDKGVVETVVVHVALRPRRGATRKCLTALAALARAHPSVPLSVTGLSKDERSVRITVGVDLGPRTGVAKFSAEAQ